MRLVHEIEVRVLDGERDTVGGTRYGAGMLLILALLLFLIFGGLGFVAHVLWWGLVLAVVLAVANALTGGSRTRR